jgi:superfamily II DNA/RNA helicase
MERGRRDRWVRLKRTDPQRELVLITRSREAKLRGVQEPALTAILHGASPVVAIMPTGGGKSVLFMLPALVEPSGITVVVVPLIALREDMSRRCEELGIRCEEWKSSRPSDGATIVLVTPESAVSEDFATFLNRLRSTRQLDRIVIDECHVVLNDKRDFRRKLQRLGELVGAEVQMVLLTATMPPSEEGKLWQRMGWKRQEVSLFRAPTVRTNIRYSVVTPAASEKVSEEEHDRLVGEVVKREKGKVVVYCNSRGRVDRLVKSGLLGSDCSGFHSMSGADRKSDMLKGFREGRVRVVVATSALGMGVDIPDIRLIVHADEPRNMMDFAQESGRAGRDGVRSRSVVVRGHDVTEDGLMEQWLGGSGCRRVGMARYLDGDDTKERCSDEEIRCDGCEEELGERGYEEIMRDDVRAVVVTTEEAEAAEVEEAEVEEVDQDGSRQYEEQQRIHRVMRMRAEEARREEVSLVERLDRRLQQWKGICAVCRGMGLDYHHIVTNCVEPDGREAARYIKSVRNKVKFEAYTCCFKCGVPQSICQRYRDDGDGNFEFVQGAKCQFYGIISSVVFGVSFSHPEVWEEMVEWLRGVGVEGEEEFLKFLGKRVDKGGITLNNMMLVFREVTLRIEKEEIVRREWEFN